MKKTDSFHFSSRYRLLGKAFFADAEVSPLAESRLLAFNDQLSRELQLPAEFAEAAIHSGERLLPGSEPLAMAYAGHQFGTFVPQLGDGRALLLGDWQVDGRAWELQLKGAGRTVFCMVSTRVRTWPGCEDRWTRPASNRPDRR